MISPDTSLHVIQRQSSAWPLVPHRRPLAPHRCPFIFLAKEAAGSVSSRSASHPSMFSKTGCLFYPFRRPLNILTMHLVFSYICWSREKLFWNKIFWLFGPDQLGHGGGKVIHFIIDISFILRLIHTTDTKTHGDGQRPIEIALPKNKFFNNKWSAESKYVSYFLQFIICTMSAFFVHF